MRKKRDVIDTSKTCHVIFHKFQNINCTNNHISLFRGSFVNIQKKRFSSDTNLARKTCFTILFCTSYTLFSYSPTFSNLSTANTFRIRRAESGTWALKASRKVLAM